jgi:hypothetical protein
MVFRTAHTGLYASDLCHALAATPDGDTPRPPPAQSNRPARPSRVAGLDYAAKHRSARRGLPCSASPDGREAGPGGAGWIMTAIAFRASILVHL